MVEVKGVEVGWVESPGWWGSRGGGVWGMGSRGGGVQGGGGGQGW